MSEGHEEPTADVRSFLPRPGEPVERYAARLRALHRDLTLVLDAVERGLAVTGRPPGEASASAPAAVAARARGATATGEAVRARVEVVRSDDHGEELEQLERGVEGGAAEDAEAAPAPAPAALAGAGAGAGRATPEAPAPPSPPPRTGVRFPARPSQARDPGPEPTWVERAATGPELVATYTAPTPKAPARAGDGSRGLVVAGLVAGWLAALVLALVLLLG